MIWFYFFYFIPVCFVFVLFFLYVEKLGSRRQVANDAVLPIIQILLIVLK
uniref:Uncharacterized protein n=1 Tax=Anopheles atroparvus TaxID=41427 RepID=A0AAG5DYI1_ANOAO